MNASANKNVFTWNITSKKIFSLALVRCTLSSSLDEDIDDVKRT